MEIEISCADRPAMLTSILAVPVEMKLNVTSVNAKTNKNDKTSIVVMGLDVRTASQVSMIMTKIRRLKDVYSVSRAMATTVDNNSNGR